MKKNLLIAIIILTASYSNAQNTYRSVGTVEFGGDFGFASQSSDGETQTIISSDLYVGYFAAEGFSIGLRPQFMTQSSDGNSYKTTNLFFNPNYNIESGNNVIPYMGLLIGYGSMAIEFNNDEDKVDGLGVGAEVGLKFTVMNSGMFLVRLEYLSQTYNFDVPPGFSGDGSETVNTILFSAGFRMFIVQGGARPGR